MPDHEVALRIAYDVLRERQDHVVMQYLLSELAKKGVAEPEECLATLPADWALIDVPRRSDSRVRLTVRGITAIDRGSAMSRRFIGVLRRCVDFYRDHEFGSPSKAEPVVAHASDVIWPGERVDTAAMRITGLLLAVEGIGVVQPIAGGLGPWEIELDASVWRYRRVGDIDDFLGMR
jgi:hypothetical protein